VDPAHKSASGLGLESRKEYHTSSKKGTQKNNTHAPIGNTIFIVLPRPPCAPCDFQDHDAHQALGMSMPPASHR
jgi:hypothetical protein